MKIDWLKFIEIGFVFDLLSVGKFSQKGNNDCLASQLLTGYANWGRHRGDLLLKIMFLANDGLVFRVHFFFSPCQFFGGAFGQFFVHAVKWVACLERDNILPTIGS